LGPEGVFSRRGDVRCQLDPAGARVHWLDQARCRTLRVPTRLNG
jgi:hypothetical protein